MSKQNLYWKFREKDRIGWLTKKLDKNIISKETNYIIAENELRQLSKKIKGISKKELIKDLINEFSMLNEANIFLQEYFKIF